MHVSVSSRIEAMVTEDLGPGRGYRYSVKQLLDAVGQNGVRDTLSCGLRERETLYC